MPPTPTTPAMTASPQIDPWFEQRGAPVAAPMRSFPALSSFPASWWMAASLALALVLLGSFYAVLNQAVARAHTHWAAAATPAVSFSAQDCSVPRPGATASCPGVDTATDHGLTTAFLTSAR